MIDTIYWGIDASGKLIISDVQVAGAVESGSFGGNVEFIESAPPWHQFADSITSIKVEKINRMVAPASTFGWFADLINVSDVDVTNLDTSNVTNMSGMFLCCGYNANTLTVKGLETWDTSNVIDMSDMFAGFGANSVTEIDLSNWDASNVTTMLEMFA